MGELEKRFLVVAGNFVQAARWAKDNGVDNKSFIYVHDETVLLGRRPDEYEFVVYGTYWTHPRCLPIYDYAVARGFVEAGAF